MSFTFLDLILFAGLIQGIFLMLSLQFVSKKNTRANKILTLLIGLSTFTFAAKMAAFQINEIWVWRTSLLSDCTIFMYGPLFYAYFKTLLFDEVPNKKSLFFQCIPSVLFLLFILYSLLLPKRDFYHLMTSEISWYVFLFMEITGIIYLSVYTYLSYRILKIVKNVSQKEYAKSRQIARFLQVVLIGFLVLIIGWSLGILKVYFIQTNMYYISYRLVWISVTTFLFIIGYFGVTQPELIRIPVQKKTTTKNRLSAEEVSELTKKLDQLIHEEEIYTHSDLSLKMLANMLQTSSNNLSWLLNSVYKKTFYEFINELRIEAFLEKVENGEHKKQTLIAIAMDAGFNSKSTFNKTFKSIMNDTPSRYIEKMYSS
ncbi:helix-turn-helix domain-containing protein [Kordia zhangzhouensis]|uniref:helix-turn-helix domain-containing protein n=1 Tax=Kordia zhangzhouensis TaxID=1620405 RepID=UPI0006298993|nr:helix-turn-helix domain-containing protein [Kordia zhangzhouensis]